MLASHRGSSKSAKEEFPGELVKIDKEVAFLSDEQVDGIRLLDDLDKAQQIQVRIGNYARGSTDFFPAMWPVTLSTRNLSKLEKESYVMAAKPAGPRYLLYIDSSGQTFLENMTQHFFVVDESHAVNMFSADGRSSTDTLLDGIMTREKPRHGSVASEEPGRLTYVIQDAIRCNGRDLVPLGILDRIAYVENEIMKPRKFRLQQSKFSHDTNEAFQLDIADYKDTSHAEEFLCSGFEDTYKYPIRSFEFLPRKLGYSSSESQQLQRVLQWAENDVHECSFRLKVSPNKKEEGDLMVGGSFRREVYYASIALTDEFCKYDGKIIDCYYADHHWIFQKARLDRKHPNGKRSVDGKLDAKQNSVNRHQLLTCLEKANSRFEVEDEITSPSESMMC